MATVNIQVDDRVKDALADWCKLRYGCSLGTWLKGVAHNEFFENQEAIADLLTATISAKVEQGRE